MVGDKPRICVSLIDDDIETMRAAAPYVDLFEVRIDLIGENWPDVARKLQKSWIAANRLVTEGGKWVGTERERIGELLKALQLGASMLDIELAAPGVKDITSEIRKKSQCLVSYHDFQSTPSLDRLVRIVKAQLEAGADICKVVTTARSMLDNITILRLFREFPETKLAAFAMGEAGKISRILSPLAGAYFTFASAKEGGESAPGQLTARELRGLYDTMTS